MRRGRLRPGRRWTGAMSGDGSVMPRCMFALTRDSETRPEIRQWITVGVTPAGTPISERMPWPDVVLLVEDPQGGAAIVRFTRDGTFAGDNDDESVEEALRQLEFEYGDALGNWEEIPADVVDPLAFALSKAREHRHGS